MLNARDAEIHRLRTILLETEDSASVDLSKSKRENRNNDSLIASLRSTIEDLTSRQSTNESALQEAILAAELEKTAAADIKSRSEAYMLEITRLSHSEASLRKEVEESRKMNADSELKFEALYKQIKGLEEDKELLNVALESKQVELTLLQRRFGLGNGATGGGGRTGLTASSSRSANRRPSSVMFSTSTTSKRRSWIPPTPTRCGGAAITGVPSTPTRSKAVGAGRVETPGTAKAKFQPLGASTKHNKTPEKRVVRAAAMDTGAKVGNGASGRLTRQSSLPVLKRSTVDLARSVSRPNSVIE